MPRTCRVPSSSMLLAAALISLSVITISGAEPAEAASGEGSCPTGTAEGALEWGTTGEAVWANSAAHQETGASETYVDVAGTIDMTLSYSDADNRNEDLDNPLLNLAPSGWDEPIYTQTDGARGSDALTIAMNSFNDDEVIAWSFAFTKPVIIPALVINDIDSVGYARTPSNVPHDSYQDQVLPLGYRGGNVVAASTALGANVVADGSGGFIASYTTGVSADLAYTDPDGWLTFTASDPVTSLSIEYSNGPDDAAAEATAVTTGGATWPSPIPQASRGVSNNHGIGVSNFAICTGILAIGDSVWADVDGDGVQDPGEPGVGGVSVHLSDANGNLIETQITSGSGDYSFTEIPPFTWVVSLDLPAGYTNSFDRDGTADGSTTLSSITASIGDADFGIQPPEGTISGLVLADRNNDGDLDLATNDTPLGGVTINLTGTNLGGDSVSESTTTASDGTYSFTVGAGNYLLNEVSPGAGYNDGIDIPGTWATVNANDSHAVVLGVDASSIGNNFAEIPTSSMSGTVYEDLDEDASQDPGEAGIVGVLITLTGTDDGGNGVSITETTGATGFYSFAQLRPGTYTVTETQPSAYLDGLDVVGTSGGSLANDEVSGIGLAVSTAATGYDFGEVVASSLAGSVRTIAGVGIAGVSVRLTGVDNLTTPVDTTVMTDNTGAYVFEAILPGTYAITEAQPTGYGDDTESLGSLGGTVGADVFSAISVTLGQQGIGYDFTEDAGSIAGTVFSDLNADGLLNGSEAGIESVSLRLTGTDVLSAAIDVTVTTASDGTFEFLNLRAGTYSVTESQPVAYTDGQDAVGNSGGTLSNDVVSAIGLSPGADYSGLLFAEIGGSLTGTVFIDSNNNGVQETGDVGIEATSLRLDGTTWDGDPFDVVVLTDASGEYVFDNVPSGTYRLRETQPGSYLDGIDTVGSSGGDGSLSDEVATITFSASDSGVGYNFGEIIGSSLAGRVIDGSAEAIEVVVINLSGTDDRGPVSRAVSTGTNGAFVFGDLRPGTYVLDEIQPASFADGDETVGTAGGSNSINDQFAGILLGQGVDATGYVFAEVGVTVTGRVALDENNNGLVDSWEVEPFIGVKIELVSGAAVVATTTTASDGSYRFFNVEPGNYTVRQIQPQGWLSTTDNEVAVSVTASGSSNINFGERGGRLLGHVFIDANQDGRDDGTQDSNEFGYGGLIVRLVDSNGEQIASTFTNADGDYLFDHLRADEYEVFFAAPPDKAWTVADVGPVSGGASNAASDQIDSDVDQVTGSLTVSLSAGAEVAHNDAGLIEALFDVSVNIVVGTAKLQIGATTAVEIQVSNNGNAPLVGGLRVTFPIPPTTTFVSAAGDGWTLTLENGEIVGIHSDPMAPGEQAPSVFVTLKTTAAGSFTPTVEVAPQDNLTEVTMVNNAASASIVVLSTNALAVTGASTGLYLLAAFVMLLAGFALHAFSRQASPR